MIDPSSAPEHFHLESSKLPVSINLVLSDSVLQKLNDISQKTGRCVDEVILEIIDSSLDGL